MKHKHAELMMQYAQDAMETPYPWERWQYQTESMQEGDVWNNCFLNPSFDVRYKYRRKPKMISVTLANGEVVSWTEPLNLQNLELRKQYFFIDADFVIHETMWIKSCNTDIIVSGMVHLTKESAEQHAAALLKINTQGRDNG